MAVVSLEGITKRYPGVAAPAVDNVTLTIEDGEFMVLLGPSGCGKSTTLRMIAGLESITEGRLTIDGLVMNQVPAKDRDIAMVFQSYALYPHMRVRDNLAFGLRRRRVPEAVVNERVKQVAATLGLTELLDRKPFALSGGQRQRVALGRAIVRDPKVFLFDEPLSNLDAALRTHTRTELIKLYRDLKATMIYVTHDQVEAMTMGSRICVMNHGRIVQVGEPLAVYGKPADTFVASFIGSPPMNLCSAEAQTVESGTDVGAFAETFRLPTRFALPEQRPQPVTFGIRPEDLHLAPPQSGASFASFKAKVLAVEPLGAETILIVETEDRQEVTARAGRSATARPEEIVELFLDLAAVHLFDRKSGRALEST